MYVERTPPAEPPCGDCRVDPFPENRDALKIFFITRYQFIMGMNGPIDMNHLAIDSAIEREGIRDRRGCFGKLLILGRWWIERVNEKTE